MSEQRFNRLFTKEGTHPYDEVEWKKTDAVIKDHRTGEIAFEQKGVEFPVFYSQNAINIITSKYFRGVSKEKTRETSYKQLLNRVIDTNILWGEEQSPFGLTWDSKEGNKQLRRVLLTL
jgi:ribonucleoside-diphosphate reductase alpha chain